MNNISSAEYFFDNAARYYLLLRNYRNLHFLQVTYNDKKELLIKNIVEKRWQSILEFSKNTDDANICLWVVGIENIYNNFYICVIEESLLPPYEVIVFLQLLTEEDFKEIPFTESVKNSSIILLLKDSFFRVVISVAKYF